MLAAPMARDLGLPMPLVFAAFSVALVVSALVGPAAGRAIDRHGGRPVLMATSLIFAAGLAALGAGAGAGVDVRRLGAARPGHGRRACTKPASPRWCGCTAAMRAMPSPASR